MKEYYEKSLRKMKELGRRLTDKEWNEIATKEGYLSTESLQYISGMIFEELCEEVLA